MIDDNFYKNVDITIKKSQINKGNTKRGVSPRLTIRPCDLDL